MTIVVLFCVSTHHLRSGKEELFYAQINKIVNISVLILFQLWSLRNILTVLRGFVHSCWVNWVQWLRGSDSPGCSQGDPIISVVVVHWCTLLPSRLEIYIE